MNRRRNTLFVIGGLALLIVFGVVATRLRAPAALPVRIERVAYGTFSVKLPETGVIQEPRLITIPAGVGGNLGTVLVRSGQSVAEGQLLATIENPQILSNVSTSEASAASAGAHARSAAQTNAALPAQNNSSVVQAEAAVVQARTTLSQARQDEVSGAQSGLGYGGQSAQEQRLAADGTLEKAATDLREAKRVFDANTDLYNQRGVSRDTLEQSRARYEEALVTWQQAQRERSLLEGTLSRNGQVLKDRVGAAEDQLRQSVAALAAARANAAQDKSGDVEAARSDAARAVDDLAYAQDQAARLRVTAPFAGVVESVASQPGDSLRPLQPGDPITPGQALFTMAGSERFIVRTKVDEQDIAGVRPGQHAIVSGEDFGGRTLRGHVVSISPLAQKSDDPSNTSRQIVTTLALDTTLPYLRDGMSVDVDIITREETHVLSVPVDAVRKDDSGKSYVFVVRKGRAQRVDVKLGTQNDTSAIVRSGLHAGDMIVADKNLAVTPDARVTTAPSASPGPAPSPGK
jgi:RND family efflux transporter MFP subunit